MGVGLSADGEVDGHASGSGQLDAAQGQVPSASLGQAASSQASPPGNVARATGSLPLTGVQGSLWSGPMTALAPANLDSGNGMPAAEASRWSLPHSSSLNPAMSSMRMLRGARSIDSNPVRLGEPTPGFASAPVRGPAEDSCVRATRAGLESEHSGLAASVGAAGALQDVLAKKVRGMREALRTGDFSYGIDEGDEGFSCSPLGLQAYRVQAVSLEAELDIYRDKIRAHLSVSERQKKEMSTLRRDCAADAQRVATAKQERSDAKESLRKIQQEHSELMRKANTEQVRVEMLRDAFETEQTRVGESLGRAEMFVSDLVAATEGTRRVEMEEQSRARECVSTLSEIHAAEAHDQLLADANCRNLRSELTAAEAALSEAEEREENLEGCSDAQGDAHAIRLSATAAYASAQSERYSAANKLSDAMKRCQEASLIAKRCVAQEELLRREVEALRQEADTMVTPIKPPEKKRSTVSKDSDARAMRMKFEETAEAAMRRYEAKIVGIVATAEEDGLDLRQGARRALSPVGASARQCSATFENELELIRSELSETRAPSISPTSQGPQDADWRLDLEAAGMQRKLGKVLAAEREQYCQLIEARLRAGELQPDDPLLSSPQRASPGSGNTENVVMLQQQINVLRNELHNKDAEISRLSSLSVGPRGSPSVEAPPMPMRGRG